MNAMIATCTSSRVAIASRNTEKSITSITRGTVSESKSKHSSHRVVKRLVQLLDLTPRPPLRLRLIVTQI